MLIPRKPFNTFTIAIILTGTFFILFISSFFRFFSGTPFSSQIYRSLTPTFSKPISSVSPFLQPISRSLSSSYLKPFADLSSAFEKWDSHIGCDRFREKFNGSLSHSKVAPVRPFDGDSACEGLSLKHVNILVKKCDFLPDNLDNLYACSCGMSCLWTKSPVLADKPDAVLFETYSPPTQSRHAGEPLRVYMTLEPEKKRTGKEDVFVGYSTKADVQSTYAGGLFHNGRNYYVSNIKNTDILVYWSSSRCVSHRDDLAKKLFSLLPHHSFGKCLNNVGGLNKALSFYPKCKSNANTTPRWWDHLHCAMSYYKFVLAIENTFTEDYVTEKLFYALDSGAIPIYFGAPNVMDIVPPNSIIDGRKFKSLEELASYVKAVANDPVAYAEYHAWRRCGILGTYVKARAMSLDTLPCRLCEIVSRKGGRNTKS